MYTKTGRPMRNASRVPRYAARRRRLLGTNGKQYLRVPLSEPFLHPFSAPWRLGGSLFAPLQAENAPYGAAICGFSPATAKCSPHFGHYALQTHRATLQHAVPVLQWQSAARISGNTSRKRIVRRRNMRFQSCNGIVQSVFRAKRAANAPCGAAAYLCKAAKGCEAYESGIPGVKLRTAIPNCAIAALSRHPSV